MQKRTKGLLLSTGIVVAIVLILGAIAFFRMYLELRKFRPYETKVVAANVLALKDGFVNMYFVKKDDSYIAIDAGTDRANVKRQLKALGVAPEKVVAILLTHTDYDHIAAVGLFPNAKVYISKPEEGVINGKVRRSLYSRNKLTVKYQTLNDGQKIRINGTDILPLVLPGHTPGSTAYQISGRYLLTGDNLAIIHGKITPFNQFFNMDTQKQRASLNKLATLTGVEVILTAHYGIGTRAEKLIREWSLAQENQFDRTKGDR